MFGQLAELPEPPDGAVAPGAGAFVEPEPVEPEPEEDELGVEVDVELSAAYAAAPPAPTAAMVATDTMANVRRSFMWIPPFGLGGG